MNKAGLSAAVAAKCGLSKRDASMAVDSIFEAIKASLEIGEAVTIMDFGTFFVEMAEARTGRNPRTGEAVAIEARTVARFKVGKELKSVAFKVGKQSRSDVQAADEE